MSITIVREIRRRKRMVQKSGHVFLCSQVMMQLIVCLVQPQPRYISRDIANQLKTQKICNSIAEKKVKWNSLSACAHFRFFNILNFVHEKNANGWINIHDVYIESWVKPLVEEFEQNLKIDVSTFDSNHFA